MPIYVYQGNSQVSTNAIRNNKVVKAIYAKEQGQEAVCVWGIDDIMIFTYTVMDNKITITGLKPDKQPTVLTVPTQINGVPVTAISSGAFMNKNQIRSVYIPDSVTNIGENILAGCSSIESLTVPFFGPTKSTKSEEDQYPLGYLFGTTSYTGGVATEQHIGRKYYHSIYTYYIPESLRAVTVKGGYYFYYSFENCTNLRDIKLPDYAVEIYDDVFNGCSSLENLTVPFVGQRYTNPIQSNPGGIDYVFGAIFDVTRTNSADPVEGATLQYVSGSTYYWYHIPKTLRNVVITNTLETKTVITPNAFMNCTMLKNITMGTGVGGDIQESAFKNCKGLTSIMIPGQIDAIRGTAFYGCTGLTSVTIPDSVTYIGQSAFAYCTGLTSITFNGTKAQWAAITKLSSWNSNTGNYTIHCTDGDIPKQ